MNKTYMAKASTVKAAWVHVDATDQVVGRLATRIATILMGKHKPIYTDHVDTGDFVVVTNAEKVHFTGKKWSDKIYRRHSLYIGGMVEIPANKMRAEHPERIITLAVKRMLPKTKLGVKMLSKLKVYTGNDHPHSAQSPVTLDVSSTRRS
jgi:large subunit ribosomal protein L13